MIYLSKSAILQKLFNIQVLKSLNSIIQMDLKLKKALLGYQNFLKSNLASLEGDKITKVRILIQNGVKFIKTNNFTEIFNIQVCNTLTRVV